MEEQLFQQYYPLYSKILRVAGLMPFDVSLLVNIRRAIYILLIFFCLYLQFLNLLTVEKTQANLIWMLSYTCVMVLFALRYCSFLVYRVLARRLFCDIANDINSVKDPVEIEIFTKCTKRAGLLVIAYLAVAAFLAVYATSILLLPTLLHTKKQLWYLHLFGYIYKEQDLQVDVTTVILAAVTMTGCFSVAGTESTVAVYSSYICGLLDISRYRMDVAIQNSAKVDPSVLINIQPSLDMQRKALEFVSSLRYHSNISRGKWPNIEVSKIYAKEGAPCPQNLVQSTWYTIPVKSQKALLYVMMKSIKDVECNLAGLYRLTYEGFAIMMNSSFSYFTLLCSTQ